jgi:hypothetical protein
MTISDDDYRLKSDSGILTGLTWHHSPYKQPSPEWDHDHCEFCFRRLAEPAAGFSDAQFEGFADEDELHWICNECFGELFHHVKDRDQWKLRDEQGPKEGSVRAN